jgi:aryl-alcohol dehydrogenase-like predicted oxidoreductase
MEQRRLGGLTVSVVGLGCNNFGMKLDERETAAVVQAAIDNGITLLDTADIYGNTKSEEFIGKALGNQRPNVILATKFGHKRAEGGGGGRPDYVKRMCEASLKRLRTDYIDLYQLHQPDPTVPIADTLGALTELVQAGKVREIGCSNFTAGMIADAEEASSAQHYAHFASVQNEYSLLSREDESDALPECERRGIAYLPYFPLASGLLTGKYRKGQSHPTGARLSSESWASSVMTDKNLNRVEKLVAFTERHRRSLLELAISWLLTHPAVASVISGATSADQVKANIDAAGWAMTAAERLEAEGLSGS